MHGRKNIKLIGVCYYCLVWGNILLLRIFESEGYLLIDRLFYSSSSSSSSSYIYHGFGPLVNPFGSHVSRSLFKVCHDSFCQLENSVSLPWVICYEAFYLHVYTQYNRYKALCHMTVVWQCRCYANVCKNITIFSVKHNRGWRPCFIHKTDLPIRCQQ